MNDLDEKLHLYCDPECGRCRHRDSNRHRLKPKVKEFIPRPRGRSRGRVVPPFSYTLFLVMYTLFSLVYARNSARMDRCEGEIPSFFISTAQAVSHDTDPGFVLGPDPSPTSTSIPIAV
ncbi:hypothetical protein EVAR_11946_1 [Eumeta japonica]|uniref:Uncharacterized protein n=1 Tax=Eumeta variegata TaxID=151549 RepID=A0A4C1U5F0_EUMVA|nr:hypothetical protein EVAR_11946_1 [Eumeta japonica]